MMINIYLKKPKFVHAENILDNYSIGAIKIKFRTLIYYLYIIYIYVYCHLFCNVVLMLVVYTQVI